MLKVLNASTSFLWKQNKMNPVLAAIESKSRQEFHALSAEQTMQLFDDRLVDSELIYGTVVEVVNEADGWSSVLVLDQASNHDPKGYPGWLRTADLVDVTPEYHELTAQVGVIHPQATLHFATATRRVTFGTVLPLVEETATDFLVLTPTGHARIAKADSQKTTDYQGTQKAERMIELAEQFLEMPYVWAGTSGCGFDCSGFMYSLHRVNGVLIPRDTGEQSENGQHVAYKEAKRGDLMLFAYEEGQGEVHHVGMFIGNDQFIHSKTPGSKVMITTLAGTWYEPELCVVTRYWQGGNV